MKESRIGIALAALAVFSLTAYIGYRDYFQESRLEKTMFAEHRLKRLLANCEAQMDNECNRVGMVYEERGGEDLATAYTAYKKACTLGNHYACGNQGRLTVTGVDGAIEANEKEGLRLLSLSCLQRKHAHSCSQAAQILAQSKDDSVFNMEKAYKAYKMGCTLGNAFSCAYSGLYVLQERTKPPSSESKQTRLKNEAIQSLNAYCKIKATFVCLLYFDLTEDEKIKQTIRNNLDALIAMCHLTNGKDDSHCKLLEGLKIQFQPTVSDSERAISDAVLADVCEQEKRALACYYRARSAVHQKDPIAKTFFEQSCKIERFIGCEEFRAASAEPNDQSSE